MKKEVNKNKTKVCKSCNTNTLSSADIKSEKIITTSNNEIIKEDCKHCNNVAELQNNANIITHKNNCDISEVNKNNNRINSCCKQHNNNNTKGDCCKNNNKGDTKSCCCETNNNKGDTKSGCCETNNTYNKGSACCGNHAKNDNELRNNIILTGVSLIFIILGLINWEGITGLKIFHYFNFAWVCVIISGTPIIVSAIKTLFKKKITSNFLITIAILGSIVLEIIRLSGIEVGGHESYIVAAGEIAILMAIGGLIEDFIVKKSKKGIERLINLKPKTAIVKYGDEFREVNLMDVKVGDIVMVYPNSKVSVDGVVVFGKSSVDASVITGEFVPVDVCENSPVFGGTWNKQGAIEVRVTKEPENMTMQKLVKLVEEAEGKKAPISRIADKWASFIVPIAIVTSILIFFITKFAFQLDAITALIRSVTVLVVFCPCALALATPTAIAAGIGNASYKGIIVKSGEALETMSRVNMVCFDKTGTLTTGEIKVEQVINYEIERKELLELLGSTEMFSDHPIAKAIYKYCENEVKLKKTSESKSLTGIGQSANINGNVINVVKFERELINNSEILKDADNYKRKGYTVINVFKNNKVVGLVCITDTVRENSSACVKNLEKNNISSVMLTGDNEESANKIAEQCGISHVLAKLMPEEKLDAIKRLQLENKVVCMVGDGVNDAPALASANCSISMGALGNEVAVEASDVAIMTNDINKVYSTLKLSKNVVKTIKRNICISMGINVLAVLLSLFGLLNPVTGAIVHNISSVFVVISSALILSKKF